ncbi:helix-turn-helix domain-containing protein [Streptomyces mirabilis]|uniref:helix-turn-helix domain-containing protein n=1 Tax=Streptomyces mirabilis TaxID=68239 RepID=UPI00365A456E
MAARTRVRYQQIHEGIERGDGLRAIARELHISRGTILRFARATNAEQLGVVRPIMCGAGCQRGGGVRTEVDVARSEGALMQLMAWTDLSMLDLYGEGLQVERAFETKPRRGDVY